MPLLPRPRFRMPLWTASAIVVGAYLARSAARGMDFRPDWPADAVVLGLFVFVVIMVSYVRNVIARDDAESGAEHADDEDGPPGT